MNNGKVTRFKWEVEHLAQVGLYLIRSDQNCGIFRTNAGGSAIIESIGYFGQGTNVHRSIMLLLTYNAAISPLRVSLNCTC